jgi:hypothetical protein
MKTAWLIGLSIFVSPGLFGQNKENQKVENGWALVYANDENGNRVSGDLEKLLSAVRNGEPIRIGWTIEPPANKSLKVEHFADAKFITILSDSTVFAQIDPIVGQTPSIKDKTVTLKGNIEWSFSASSLGNNDSMNVNTKTGEIMDHKPFKCGIKWFRKTCAGSDDWSGPLEQTQ